MVALVSGITPVDSAGRSCLLCSVCRFLLIKPKQTECGHRYCTACLENLFKTDNEADCHVCQQKVFRSKVYRDRAAENDAYATKIQCTAYRDGCDWTGTLRNYLRTHRAQCDFHVVPCSNVAFGCETVGPRKKMLAHETQECEWRMELCPRCETFCTHKLLEDHITMCTKRKETCPVCGKTDLTKAELEEHCDPDRGTCPDAQVSCPFKDIGCLENPRRRDVDDHLQAGQPEHLLLMLKRRGGPPVEGGASAPASEELSALGRKADALSRELERYAHLVEALQRRCLHSEQLVAGLQRRVRALEGAREQPASTNGILLWKIRDFASCLAAARAERVTSFYSPAFQTHPFGYRLCCRLYPNGDGNGRGSHLSLFLAVVRGDYDDVLPWPFRQRVTFLLLDQAQQKHHLRESFAPDALSGSFQKPQSRMNVASGCPTFARHEMLHRDRSPYLRDDTLYIKVVVDTTGLVP
ncbi:TNF receptor-associated factor 2-like [Hemiscyllium ocellatum]|uniref:TNF receptor-associated factor 2-like n=1 Tax=Hemiscyllium ocellatum TaxID=170820 RepID=UPI0029660511|nr:TNF receptor-associated factor 2-like [Hemiscyllium ocellatum]